MADLVVKKSNKLGVKVWLSIVVFGLMGQLAWMVENMYFSTYIQKEITTNGWATSATVAASAVVAAQLNYSARPDSTSRKRARVPFGFRRS